MCKHETGVITNFQQIILSTISPQNACDKEMKSNTPNKIIVFKQTDKFLGFFLLQISLQFTCFYLQHFSLVSNSTVSVSCNIVYNPLKNFPYYHQTAVPKGHLVASGPDRCDAGRASLAHNYDHQSDVDVVHVAVCDWN